MRHLLTVTALTLFAGADIDRAPWDGRESPTGPEAFVAVAPGGVSDPTRPTTPPAIVDHLLGAWEGEGELFGRPTEFAMSWAWELDGSFMGLAYEIRGDTRMEARAYYRIGDQNTADGIWVDSRGEILELEATVTDSTLTTTWRSPTERGRTIYQRTGVDSLEVSDFFHNGTDWQPFGTASYARR